MTPAAFTYCTATVVIVWSKPFLTLTFASVPVAAAAPAPLLQMHAVLFVLGQRNWFLPAVVGHVQPAPLSPDFSISQPAASAPVHGKPVRYNRSSHCLVPAPCICMARERCHHSNMHGSQRRKQSAGRHQSVAHLAARHPEAPAAPAALLLLPCRHHLPCCSGATAAVPAPAATAALVSAVERLQVSNMARFTIIRGASSAQRSHKVRAVLASYQDAWPSAPTLPAHQSQVPIVLCSLACDNTLV